MVTTYPGTLDNFTNPGPSDYEDVVSHSGQHSNANDAIEAIETVLGTTAGTAVLKDFVAGQFPARINSGGTLSQVITGGTLNNVNLGTVSSTGGTFTNPNINVGSDAAGDMYYRGTAGDFARVGAGTASAGKFLTTNGTTPSWATVSSAIQLGTCTVSETSSIPNTTWASVTGGTIVFPCQSGDNLMVIGQVTGQNSSASGRTDLRIYQDGSTNIAQSVANIGAANKTMTNAIMTTVVASGTSHTFVLQYSDQLASGGTVTVFGTPFTYVRVINLKQ